MKRHSKKLLAIIVGVILAFPCVSVLCSVFTIPNVYAQENSTTVGAEKIKEMLLRPGGWLVEWRGNSSGVNDFIFEDRGEKVVVKINNAAWKMSCERDVTITADVVKLDGCYDTNISLFFDLYFLWFQRRKKNLICLSKEHDHCGNGEYDIDTFYGE